MSDAINPAASIGAANVTTAASATTAARGVQSDLHRVASEFEAMLLRQLLHTSKMGGGGSYGDMAVDALATGISDAGGIGLTRQLESVLAGQMGAQAGAHPAAPAAPPVAPEISRSSSGEGGRSNTQTDTF